MYLIIYVLKGELLMKLKRLDDTKHLFRNRYIKALTPCITLNRVLTIKRQFKIEGCMDF